MGGWDRKYDVRCCDNQNEKLVRSGGREGGDISQTQKHLRKRTCITRKQTHTSTCGHEDGFHKQNQKHLRLVWWVGYSYVVNKTKRVGVRAAGPCHPNEKHLRSWRWVFTNSNTHRALHRSTDPCVANPRASHGWSPSPIWAWRVYGLGIDGLNDSSHGRPVNPGGPVRCNKSYRVHAVCRPAWGNSLNPAQSRPYIRPGPHGGL